MKTFLKFKAAAIAIALMGLVAPAFAQSDNDASSQGAALKRMTSEIKYLASDELGGRQPGTPGIVLAEKFIVKAFKEAGLKPAKGLDNFFQEFSVGSTREFDKEASSFTLNGKKLKLGKDYSTLQARRSYEVSGDVVFLGYGINAEDDHNYNEYRDLDVNGKVAVVIRREPQQNDPDSVFDGKEVSEHSYVRRKIELASEAGAVAILFVNDSITAPDDEKDALAAYDQFGTSTNGIPFVHVKRSVIDGLLKKNPLIVGDGVKLSSVAQAEKHIDKTLEPISQPIKDAKVKIKTEIVAKKIMTNNIVGVIEGEGPNADETIIIGAHYDHIGTGGYGSNAPDRRGEIHNGADDNATGTAGIMELARRFGTMDKKPGRRMVFIAFSAEEMGLLGALHFQ